MDLQNNGYHYLNLETLCDSESHFPEEYRQLQYWLTTCQNPKTEYDIKICHNKSEYLVNMCLYNCYYSVGMNQLFQKYKKNIPEKFISNNNIFANVNR